MTDFHNFPAIIYMFFWQLEHEGRLHDSTKNVHLKFLFAFEDYPPATILEIANQTFQVSSIDLEDLSHLNRTEFDGVIEGKLAPILALSWNRNQLIRALVHRELKIKGLGKFMKILKILQYQGPFSEKEEN